MRLALGIGMLSVVLLAGCSAPQPSPSAVASASAPASPTVAPSASSSVSYTVDCGPLANEQTSCAAAVATALAKPSIVADKRILAVRLESLPPGPTCPPGSFCPISRQPASMAAWVTTTDGRYEILLPTATPTTSATPSTPLVPSVSFTVDCGPLAYDDASCAGAVAAALSVPGVALLHVRGIRLASVCEGLMACPPPDPQLRVIAWITASSQTLRIQLMRSSTGGWTSVASL